MYALRSFSPLVLLYCLLAMPVKAEPITPPQGRVILSILGNVSTSNADDGALHFDYAMLAKLPQTHYVTDTPYTNEPHTYQGPTLAHIARLAGIEGKKLTATALNNYSTALDHYALEHAILAINRDGQPMRIRNKGPIWVMFPLDQQTALDVPDIHQQMIWQLRSISAK